MAQNLIPWAPISNARAFQKQVHNEVYAKKEAFDIRDRRFYCSLQVSHSERGAARDTKVLLNVKEEYLINGRIGNEVIVNIDLVVS